MAKYFAKIENNRVIQVDVIDDSSITTEQMGINFLNNHYNDNSVWKETKEDGSIRNKFASVDDHYDSENDVFYPQKPNNFDSWTLNKTTWEWEAPVARPSEGMWKWNEDDQVWVEKVLPPQT